MYKEDTKKDPMLDEEGHPQPLPYRHFLTRYTNDFARAAMSQWWELGDILWGIHARGW
jgi:hypothetical protein